MLNPNEIETQWTPWNKWFKWAMGTIIILFCLLLLTSANASTLEDVSKSTYRLYHNNVGTCTTVAVSPTEFVTAAHCIPTEQGHYSVRFGNHVHLLEVISVNVDNDVALLSFKPQDYKIENAYYVDVSVDHEPSFGDRLYAVGFPRMDILTITEGLFTGLVDMSDFGLKSSFYKTTVPITGGSSGGGLYYSYWSVEKGRVEYELIGLATANWRDVSFQSYFSTLTSLRGILNG